MSESNNPFFENTAMYLRKSRAEEGEDTAAVLARHKAQLTKYAVEHHITVSKIYEEVVSGDSLFARPRMIALLHDIEAGFYTGILCTDIDRLGRGNMKEQGLILETFKDAGTAIITPDKIYDLNNELDETQSEFKTFMARQELKIIKKRLSRGIRLTIEKGGYVSNVPFGYVRAYKDKIPTLAPHPEESKTVQLIFNLYISGDGCQAICNKLNVMGAKPHRGNEFCRSSIRRILTNPVYTGKIVWGQKKYKRPKKPGEKHRAFMMPKDKWLIFNGLHPPIIDDDTFKKANAILAGRYHPPYFESAKIANPLAGLLFCRKCGRAMTRRPFGKRKYQTEHILCPTAGCMKSSRADYIEEKIIEELELKLRNIKIEPDLSSAGGDLQDETVLENMKSGLLKLKKQREKLYDLVEQGVYTVPVFSQREKLVSERIGTLSEDIGTFENKIDKKRGYCCTAVPKITSVLQEYRNASPEEKNRLLKTVIKKAYYYKTKNAGPHEFTIEIELKEV